MPDLTQCVTCKGYQDETAFYLDPPPNLIPTHTFCQPCFIDAIRYNQIQKKGKYCFQSGINNCTKNCCAYYELCQR